MLTPEDLTRAQQAMVAAMGVPADFLFGAGDGVNSGAEIRLRLEEAQRTQEAWMHQPIRGVPQDRVMIDEVGIFDSPADPPQATSRPSTVSIEFQHHIEFDERNVIIIGKPSRKVEP